MDFSIVFDEETAEDGATLSVSYTTNNGLRIQIHEDDSYGVFDMTADQARKIAGQLLEIAIRRDLSLAHDQPYADRED